MTPPPVLLLGFDAITRRLMSSQLSALERRAEDLSGDDHGTLQVQPSIDAIWHMSSRTRFMTRPVPATVCLAPDARLYAPAVISPMRGDQNWCTLECLMAPENLAATVFKLLITHFLCASSCTRIVVFQPPRPQSPCMFPDEFRVPLGRPLPEEVREIVGYEVFNACFSLSKEDLGAVLNDDPRADAFLDMLRHSPNLNNDGLSLLSESPSHGTLPFWSVLFDKPVKTKMFFYGGSSGGYLNAAEIRCTIDGAEKSVFILPTPVDLAEMHAVLLHLNPPDKEDACRIRDRLKSMLADDIPFKGEAPVLATLFRQLLMTAMGKARHVLLLGETGSGKEVAAQIIHCLTAKRNTLTSVNCASFCGGDANIANAAIFGCAKGSHSKADEETPGLVHEAKKNGGNLFLDEIQDLPEETKQNLLRFMETGEYSKVGDSVHRAPLTGVRIIGATNKSGIGHSAAWEKSGFTPRFGHVITLPPLRHRPGDVSVLAKHFYTEGIKRCKASGSLKDALDAQVDGAIRSWSKDDWLNENVRGLKMAVDSWIERACLEIELGDSLSSISAKEKSKRGRSVKVTPMALQELIDEARGWRDLIDGYSRLTGKSVSDDGRAIHTQISRKCSPDGYDQPTRDRLHKKFAELKKTVTVPGTKGRPRKRKREKGINISASA
jgi:transcriptional regulator with AAA-type ATPase domain